MTANQWWVLAIVVWLLVLASLAGCASRNSYDYGALAVGVGKQLQKPQPKP